MTFTLAGTIVEVLDVDASGVPYSAPITGVLISRNEVLITGFAVSSLESSSSAVKINLSVDPASITSTNLNSPSGFHMPTGVDGLPVYTATASSVHYSTVANGEEVALVNLGTNVDLASTVGYLGLAQDTTLGSSPTLTYTTYPSTSPPQTQYFPTITQQSFSASATEQPSNLAALAPYYSTFAINPPSTTPAGLGAVGTSNLDSATDVANIREGFGPSSAGYNTPDAAMTSTMIAQIEYWQALDNESPAIQRLFHGLLGRAGTASDLAFYSPSYATAEKSVASSEGVPFTSSTAVIYNHPEFADYFLNSPEFTSAHPNITGTSTAAQSALVNLLYTNELGRSASASDLSLYVGHYTNEQIVAFIVGSPEAIAHSGVWGQTGVLV